MLTIMYVFYFVLQGALIGSFLNVLCDRLPKGASLLGRSKCDGCGRKLGYLELVPILSYIIIGGKSTCCKKKLSNRYSVVESITALSFGIVSYTYFSQSSKYSDGNVLFWVGLVGLLIITASSIAISIIDFDHQIIPDVLQLVFFVGSVMYVLSIGELGGVRFAQAFLVSMPILLIYLGTKGNGMGYGDIKLAYTLGLWLGLTSGVLGLYFGFIIGAIYGLVLMAMGKAKRKSHIAFGPFLIFGAWLAHFFAPSLIRMVGF